MLRLVTLTAACAAGVAWAGPPQYQEPSAAELGRQQALMQQQAGQADAYYQSPSFEQLIGKERKKVEQIKPAPDNKLEIPADLTNQRWGELLGQAEQTAKDIPAADAGVHYGPLVFASLSVGRENLKLLASDAQRGGGAVVFRGVKNNDFRAMRSELAGMGEGFVVDPTLFQRFGITEVPTTVLPLGPVVPCEPDGCPAIEFVKVAGNVTVEAAMDYIRINSAKPKARALADGILKRIRE